MEDKYIYSILLLVLVIILSQIFAMILSIPILREGLEDGCLPECKDISLNMSDGKAVIPDCKKIIAKQLTPEDATKSGLPIVNTFLTNITNHLNEKYRFTELIFQLKNANTNITQGDGFRKNTEQVAINKYFTDSSTNQDVLDNMAEDTKNFETILREFHYSLDKDNPTQEIKNTIIAQINSYKEERQKSKPNFSDIYNKFIGDMKKLYNELNSRCKDYYSDEVLNSIINDTPSYYGKNSTFHRLYNYIDDAIHGKLGQA